MRKYLLAFLFLISLNAQAQFTCRASVSTMTEVWRKYLDMNRIFQVFEWNDYLMSLHYEEDDWITFRVRSSSGARTLVYRSLPSEMNPIELKLYFEGYIFRVSCLQIYELVLPM